MRRELEALLFATDQPLSIARLASYFPGVERGALKNMIEELRAEYDRDEHAFTIVEFGGGYSIATRPEFAPVVKKLYKGRRKLRLSKAALEVLSIIAYKQPVTRLEIEEIRGIQASGVLGTLMERELVEIVGRAEGLGSPLLYGTTSTFLEYLGLRTLKELPRLSELEDLLSEREEIKQLAGQLGEEISDEEFEAVVNPPQPEQEEEEEKPSAGNGDEAPEAGETDASLSRSEGAAD
jgi:segregation and condensation protein B